MRRLICCFVITILLSVAVLPVSAKGNTYQIPEMDMTIEIPSSYDVFTLDMDEDDPLFEKYGYTKEIMDAFFQSEKLCAYAIGDAGKRVLKFSAKEHDDVQNVPLQENTLLEFGAILQENQRNSTMPIIKYDIYHHPQLLFLRMYLEDTETETYGLQYYTMYNKKAIYITLQSVSSIKLTEEKLMQSIVDSIEVSFTEEIGTLPEGVGETIFTDGNTGTTFSLPAGWMQEEIIEGRYNTEMNFVSVQNSNLSMSYSSSDIWGRLPREEQALSPRNNMDNSAFTEENIAEMFGVTSGVKKITFLDYSYYMVQLKQKHLEAGVLFYGKATYLVRFENGWMYTFYFSGADGDRYYADFEQLMNSVQYPSISNAQSDYLWILGIGSVVIVTAVLLVFLIRNKKRKRQDAVPAAPAKQPILFCRECGKRLDANSRFCSECGTQVVEVGKEAEQ